MRHIYPIRTTRKKWKIPLFCYHECGEYCQRIFVSQDSGLGYYNYNEIDNPDFIDGKCSKLNKLEDTYINFESFNIENPCGAKGKLYKPNMIVINDVEFTILISFPLLNPIRATFKNITNDGITLKNIIFSIKKLYKYIYEEEERTASIVTYSLRKTCDNCNNIKVEDYLNEAKIESDEECCICYSKYTTENKGYELKCNHVFHKNCIYNWLLNKSTCPLCRSNYFECVMCDNTGYVYYNYTGKVIPPEIRGEYINRNQTDGIFGIYGYDYNNLVLSQMEYNRIDKELKIVVNSIV